MRLGRALLLGRRPNYVIAFVTGRCNLKCSFCCHAARTARDNIDAPELSAEQWASMFAGLDALIHLTITGGEPFMRKDIVELVRGLVQSARVPRISINTNGFLTDTIMPVMETLVKELRSVEIALAVSIDGPEAIHDSLRGVPGSFRAARETVRRAAVLRDHTPRFSVRTCSVVCRENADCLELLLEETSTWPIDFHDIGLLRDVPRDEQRELAETYAKLTNRQLQHASARYFRGVDWRLQRQVRDEVLAQVYSDDRRFHCLAGDRLLEVFPDGSIRGCEMGMLWDESLIAEGSERPVRLADAVRSPAAKRFRQRATACGCTFECVHGCNAVFQPGRWWRLLP